MRKDRRANHLRPLPFSTKPPSNKKHRSQSDALCCLSSLASSSGFIVGQSEAMLCGLEVDRQRTSCSLLKASNRGGETDRLPVVELRPFVPTSVWSRGKSLEPSSSSPRLSLPPTNESPRVRRPGRSMTFSDTTDRRQLGVSGRQLVPSVTRTTRIRSLEPCLLERSPEANPNTGRDPRPEAAQRRGKLANRRRWVSRNSQPEPHLTAVLTFSEPPTPSAATPL